ncbi:DUF2130 domain-containing protein [Aliikangiella maris]|uniref:DUF2130 domain-containing protein n=2 Tax=Aliikangiella maris TaxID=3162458 RepID=A0ABV2BR62_9GAMM
MSSTSVSKVECPECGHTFDVNEVLSHQLEEKLRRQYENKSAQDKLLIEQQQRTLASERQQLIEEKAQQAEQVANTVAQQVKEKTTLLRKSIAQELEAERTEQFKLLQQELNDKSEQLKQLSRTQIELERIKREKSELKESIEAEAELKLTRQLAAEKQRIQQAEADKNSLYLAEKEKIIEQLKNQLDIAKRKAEQGSTQLQGEVQELAIEEWLNEQFPLDTIEEIKKGARGADCLQIVNTRNRTRCGVIYYESKRTQSFQPGWIEKFKQDIRDQGADIGVLVTQAMPADLDRLGLKEGIWICSFEEFKGLSLVLRDSIIRTSRAIATQENKGEKMVMLYDYLTGNEFRMQVEAIVEGFSQMQEDLNKEKRAMMSIWKKREKQIEKVLFNTANMYSSIHGIAGNVIKALPSLDLPEEN